MKKTLTQAFLLSALAVSSSMVFADSGKSDKSASNNCAALPNHSALKQHLTTARNQSNGGFNLDMWGTIVDRDGIVCAVAYTGGDRGAQWPGSRVISAQKANTANAFSLPGLALSSANLYTATQPGDSLFGLQLSNPVDTEAAYKGPSKNYGQAMLWSAQEESPLTPKAPSSLPLLAYSARPSPNTFTPPIFDPTNGSLA
jgi:hypothetical protein